MPLKSAKLFQQMLAYFIINLRKWFINISF